jgi:hypothetical protein
MSMLRRFALVVVPVLLACGEGKPDECAVYARRDFECGGYPEREREITLRLAEGFCREIRAGNEDLQGLTSVKAGPRCATTTTTCEAYKACLAEAERSRRPGQGASD